MSPREHDLAATVRLYERRAGNLKRRGYAYRNHYDFLLREGEFYVPAERPAHIAQMAPTLCFFNAMLVSIAHRVPYAEGMAIGPAGGPAFHHAWNVAEDGRVIETTWRPQGRAYLGVRFSVARANEATWDGDASVLQDQRLGLLLDPWSPEDSPGPDLDDVVVKMATDVLSESTPEQHGVAGVDELVAIYRAMPVPR